MGMDIGQNDGFGGRVVVKEIGAVYQRDQAAVGYLSCKISYGFDGGTQREGQGIAAVAVHGNIGGGEGGGSLAHIDIGGRAAEGAAGDLCGELGDTVQRVGGAHNGTAGNLHGNGAGGVAEGVADAKSAGGAADPAYGTAGHDQLARTGGTGAGCQRDAVHFTVCDGDRGGAAAADAVDLAAVDVDGAPVGFNADGAGGTQRAAGDVHGQIGVEVVNAALGTLDGTAGNIDIAGAGAAAAESDTVKSAGIAAGIDIGAGGFNGAAGDADDTGAGEGLEKDAVLKALNGAAGDLHVMERLRNADAVSGS